MDRIMTTEPSAAERREAVAAEIEAIRKGLRVADMLSCDVPLSPSGLKDLEAAWAAFHRLDDAALTPASPSTAPTPAAEEVDGLPAGMVPWHGGDSAPADWDGGPVRFREAGLSDQRAVVGAGRLSWEHVPHAASFDIIGYTPRAPSTQLQPGGAGFNETADPLKVAEEWRERCARVAESEFADPNWNPIMRNAGGAIATAIRAQPLTGAGAGGEEG